MNLLGASQAAKKVRAGERKTGVFGEIGFKTQFPAMRTVTSTELSVSTPQKTSCGGSRHSDSPRNGAVRLDLPFRNAWRSNTGTLPSLNHEPFVHGSIPFGCCPVKGGDRWPKFTFRMVKRLKMHYGASSVRSYNVFNGPAPSALDSTVLRPARGSGRDGHPITH